MVGKRMLVAKVAGAALPGLPVGPAAIGFAKIAKGLAKNPMTRGAGAFTVQQNSVPKVKRKDDGGLLRLMQAVVPRLPIPPPSIRIPPPKLPPPPPFFRIPKTPGRPPMPWPRLPGLPNFGAPRRRRRRARLTSRELQELILLKSVLGSRSPALTIAAFKMLDRG